MVMPRTDMRKIREILRLRYDLKRSFAEISVSVHLGKTTVLGCVRRFEASGLAWPLPESISDQELENLMYRGGVVSSGARPLPDFAEVHLELRRKGVTQQLLWSEYKQNNQGYRI